MIEPRTLKGFRDYLPEAALPREAIIETARRVYRSFGFAPIDTPALEYAEILLGKGGADSDKQMYRFTDHGGRDVALRFDLTVPLARFTAQYLAQLGKPFKRYHVGSVWRGENTQRGRYREFMQCDFDTIGTESVLSDVETVVVVHDLFVALGFDKFTLHVNNRKALTGLLERLGVADKSVPILRAIDKLEKAGADKVAAELVETTGIDAAKAREVLQFATIEGDAPARLARIEELVRGSERGERGAFELREVLKGAAAAGVPESRLQLDVSIARGLDYYTGLVYETTLDELPGIGSVSSGGRYDDLASLYTKERLPGVGGSLGLDRLLAAMEELGRVDATATPAPIFLAFFEETRRDDYLALATKLRRSGLGVEIYPEPKKLGAQLKYADKKGHRLAIVIGADEFARGVAQVKNLKAGSGIEVALIDLPLHCRATLEAPAS